MDKVDKEDKESRSWDTPPPEQVAVWERPREDSSKEEEETGGRLEESNEDEKEVEEELPSTERRSPEPVHAPLAEVLENPLGARDTTKERAGTKCNYQANAV